MTLRFAVAFCLGLSAFAAIRSVAEDGALAPDAELAAEIEKERKTAERFLTLLERNPREGTSLDRAYGFFVGQGMLDELIATYRKRVEADETDGAAWMILGLIEARRGNDATAIESFAKATEHRPADPMAAYYLGRAYAVAGRPDQAIVAFEQAVARKPARADLPPIFAELGRLHQRAGRQEDAAAVWDRLEAAFPGDERVKAEIAAILEEEGQAELALKRYEELATSVGDEYRRVTYALKAAGLKARLGQRDEAVADFERLLGRLDPDDWLYREARRGVEQVFLRTDDLDGLASYYETWIEKHPEDVAAMTRLAGVLGDLGRGEDARGWFEKATKLAPSDVRLRRAYIDALRRGGKSAEAIAQFEALDEVSPNDPDIIRDWGTVYLEDGSLPEAERKAKAADIWKRLTAARPEDAVVTAQVADWFRQAEMPDEALALYAKAITLAPDDPRYLEYLGEYQHQLGKKEEAVATWKKLAAGENRTTENLVRLAEVLSGFGYKEEAVATFLEADGMDLGFADRLRFAELLRDQEKYDESLAQIAKAELLAESDEERQNALAARIETDQAANRLEPRIEELRTQVAENPAAESWLTLALYLHASRDTAAATEAAREAVKLDPRSTAAQATLARLADESGQLLVAADAFRRLAALDRRGRTEYLKQVAGLEQRLGKTDDALATAREVLASAPGSPDAYAFYADLCFRLGRTDEGLDALRRAARLAPSDPGPTLALAAALAEQFRTGEAVELYWQAFDKAEAFDDKVPIVTRLAELYLRTNRFDELVKRLERESGGSDDRETRLLVAEAYQATGDLVRAGETLQTLLAESPRDTQLLSRLSQLAERDRDYETALRYQREIVEIAPEDRQEKARLAQLYLASDGIEAGPEFWDELLNEDLDEVETLSLIDALLGAEKYDDALRLTDRRLRETPEDWELLYRRAFALLKQDGKQDQAAETFRRLLALDLPDDAESARLAAMRKRAVGSSSTSQSNALNRASFPKLLQRTQSTYQVLAVLGISDRNVYYRGATSGRALGWTPNDYGAARVAALGWLGHHAVMKTSDRTKKDETLAEFRKTLRDAAMAKNSSKRERLDWYYAVMFDRYLRQNTPSLNVTTTFTTAIDEAAKRLAELGDAEGAWVYLWQLATTRRQSGSGAATAEPLPGDELELMLRCYEKVRHENAGYYSNLITTTVAQELGRSGRKDGADRLVQEMLAASDDPNELGMVLQFAAYAEDLDTVHAVFDRLDALPPDKLAAASNVYSPAAMLMRKLWDDGKRDEAMRLLDRQFALTERRLDAARTSASSTPRASSGRFGLTVWHRNGVQQQFIVDGSEMNGYLGIGGLTLLRNALELHKDAETVEEFVAGLTKRAEAASGPKAAMNWMAVAAIHKWEENNGDIIIRKRGENHGAVIAAIRSAVEAVPEDYGLRLTLARRLQDRGEYAEALAVIDAVEPLDAAQLCDRELLALDLAASLLNIDRAKKAAERLFGLRLDAQQQIRLANVMQQVGMAEQAEAVLARLRTQGGGAVSTQIELLRHYRGTGQNETAIEIAREIVRRTKPNPNRNVRTVEDTYREEAVRLLKESGQLDTLIADAKRQADRAPNSVEAQRQLAEYYAAAGKAEEAAAVLKAVSDRRPNDVDLKYELAGRVAAMGRASEAVDLYAAALEAKPELMNRDFYEMERVFTQANRGKDLLELIGEMDFSRGGELHYAVNAISNKLDEPNLKETALASLDSLLANNPGQRSRILQQIHSQAAWDDPKVAGYALDMVKSEGEKLTWDALSNYTSISSGGQVRTLFNNVASAAAGEGRREEFHKTVAALVEKHPDWQPGQAMLAISEAAQGRHDDARGRLRAILDDEESPIPSRAAWAVGLELEQYGLLGDLAVEFVERAVEANERDGSDFQFTPTALLVELYGKAGRKEEARKIILTKGLDLQSDGRYSDPMYQAYSEMRHYVSIADKLLELGYPIDALRVYDRHAAEPRRVQAARQQGSYVLRQIQEGREKALAAIDASNIAAFLIAAAEEKPREGEPAFDLVLSLGGGTELGQMTVESVIASAVRKALDPSAEGSGTTINRTHKGKSPPAEAAPAEAMRTSLASLREKRPDDLSVQVVAAVAAFAVDDVATGKAAGEAALAAAEKAARSRRDGEKTPPRGDSDAPPQEIALWVVAREAAKHPEARPLADELAERALAAVRDTGDRRWSVAMLRERGQQALDSGDRAAAEAAWSEALDLILPPKESADEEVEAKHDPADEAKPRAAEAAEEVRETVPSQKTSAVGPPTGIVAALALTLPAQPAASAVRTSRVVTLAQAIQALELAELAAKNGMTELSFRAVRQSLGDGRPVNLSPADPANFPIISSSRSGLPNEVAQIEQQVAERLLRIDAAWRDKGADPVAVYETFAAAVLPESRGEEAFLYLRPLEERRADAPESGGRLLVSWAAKAGKLDDLDRRLAGRPADGPSGVAVSTLRVLSAYESGDAAAAVESLSALTKRIATSGLRGDAEAVCHAALPGLSKPEVAPAAVDALTAAVGKFAESGSEQPFGWLTLRLAEHEFRLGRDEEAEKRLDGYVAAVTTIYSRHPGDYAVARRRAAFQVVARTLARHGRSIASIERLGEVLELPTSSRYYDGDALASAPFVAALCRGLAADPSPDAYDRLKAWTFPAGERKGVRMTAALTPSPVPPAEFGLPPDPAATTFGTGRVPVVTGTAAALVELAKRDGKLGELVAETDRLADAGVENAAILSILAHAAAGTGAEAAPRLDAIVAEFIARPAESIDFNGPEVPNLLLVAFAAASDSALRPAAARIAARIDVVSRNKTHGLHPAARFLSAACLALDAGLAPADVLPRNDFGPWRVGRMPRPQDRHRPRIPPVWAVRDGVARQTAGSEADPLVFRYPLTGEFDILLEAWDGGHAEGFPDFNGLSYEPYAWNKKASVFEIGRWGDGVTPFENKRSDAYNTFTFRVRPGEVRCLVNGDEMHVDSAASAGSPFLTLNSFWGRSSWFRGIRIEGDPVIPREVRLLDGDRLDGWAAFFFDETKPHRPGTDAPGDLVARPAGEPPVWTVSGGVLSGRPLPSGPFRQSWLYYHRPLWDGESVEYEFFHGEGDGVVHPTLGRLAFLLDPAGVRLHWITGEGDDEWTGLAFDNAVDAPQHRRGPDAIPLKPGEWNAVKVVAEGENVRIELNGQLVFERPLAATDSRLFGLFRYSDSPVRVRNVVLRGDWPERLDGATKADLLKAVPNSPDPKVMQYERAVITETHLNGSP